MSDTQCAVERTWLDLTREVVRAPDGACVCRPSSSGVRWSGYLGSQYSETRALLVGANHNGRATGLLGTPAMGRYNRNLAAWAASPPSADGDAALLAEMRATYRDSWTSWGAVWRIFGVIRTTVDIPDEGFAFVNLARCPDPRGINDDVAIRACQPVSPLAHLVAALQPRIIFLAKGGQVGRSLQIPGENTEGGPLVIRYGNGSRGMRNGRHYSSWIPEESERLRAGLLQGA